VYSLGNERFNGQEFDAEVSGPSTHSLAVLLTTIGVGLERSPEIDGFDMRSFALMGLNARHRSRGLSAG
jgi:hypothetical protein